MHERPVYNLRPGRRVRYPSPESTDAFRSKLKKRIRRKDSLSRANEGHEVQLPVTPEEETKALISRYQAQVPRNNSDRMSVQQFVNHLASPQPNTRERAKALPEVFKRVMSGIEDVPGSGIWFAVFSSQLAVQYRPRRLINMSRQCDGIQCKETRLVYRLRKRLACLREAETQMSHAPSDVTALVFLKVEELKFSAERKGMRRADVTTFYDQAFIEAHPEYFVDKSSSVHKYKEQRDLWVRMQEETVTARNRLLEAFINFGSIVLLDPFWSTASVEPDRFGKHLRAMIRVVESLPCTGGVHPLSRQQPSIEDALLAMMDAKLGKPGVDFLKDFLIDMQPHMRTDSAWYRNAVYTRSEPRPTSCILSWGELPSDARMAP